MNKSILVLLLIIGCSVGCSHRAKSSLEEFSTEAYRPQYAVGFSILNSSDAASSIIKVRNPWQGAHDQEQMLFISRNDERPPKDFTGQVAKTAHRIICMSSSHVAMIDALEQVRRVVGVSGIQYITNEYINHHKLCGEVRDVGYDTNLNFERIVALDPDIVLLYGVTGENRIITDKLTELSIPYIYIGDYTEESPLGKAEWIVAIGEIMNCREEAESVFTEISSSYNTLKRRMESVTSRPTVMLNTPYRDTWFMPSTRSYMVQLIDDAGGEYIYKGNDSSSSLPISLEEAYVLTSQADFWLNVGTAGSLATLQAENPKFASMSVVKRGAVYNNNSRHTLEGGSDFWESGVVRPDRVLQDLITILHPEIEDFGLYYYKQLK